MLIGFKASTAIPAQARAATGMSAKGISFAAEYSHERSTANEASIRSPSDITANAPQCGSFNILCRVSRSRRERTASHTSMNPSRWIKPVTAHGSAVMSAAVSAVGNPSRFVKYARSAQRPPTMRPMTGRQTSILSSAFSSHFL